MNDLSHVRKEYGLSTMAQDDVATDPFAQFERWYQTASQQISEANAMVLATSDNKRPSQRLLLLKSYDEHGFVFYTNYKSRKAVELSHNPNASLLFWWKSLEQQVRIEGVIEKVSPEQSDKYFATRCRDAQLGAHASPQSQVIANRAALEQRFADYQQQYSSEQSVPRPEHWGGYRLIPDYFEFWQGRQNRLHDRFAYRLTKQQWELARLAP